MRGLASLVVLSFVAVAGCVQTDEPLVIDQPVPFQTQGISEIHMMLDVTGNTTFFWSADWGEANHCKWAVGLSALIGPGQHALQMEETPSGTGWFFFHQAATGIHAGSGETGVDTRPILSSEGGGGLLSQYDSDIAGVWNVTIAANLQHNPFGFTGNGTATFDAVCDKPFDLDAAKYGFNHVLSDGDDMSGGTGMGGDSFASVTRGDSLARRFSNGTVRVVSSGFGYQVADLTVEHPGGATTWNYPGVPTNVGGLEFYSLEDDPGDYTITINRVGAYVEALWIGVWSPSIDIDLEAVTLDHQAYVNPFE